MRDTELTELKGFEEAIPANPKPEWAKVIRRQRQEVLDELRGLHALPVELAKRSETDVFPLFQTHVWKNQRPPKGRRGDAPTPPAAREID
jgi:hypothetical protein